MSEPANPPPGPSRRLALLGLLENEHDAVERRIQRVTEDLNRLAQTDVNVDDGDLQASLESLQQELTSLERQQAELVTELAAARAGNGQPGIDAATSHADGDPQPIFIPANKPSEPSPAIDNAQYSPTMRRRIQEALILSGGYDSNIDGDFGPRTEQAVRVFQEKIGAEPTGILTDKERADLFEKAAQQHQVYGLRRLEDDSVGYSLVFPSELLTEEDVSGDGYRVLSDSDGTSSLQVVAVEERDLRTLFDDLTGHEGVGYSHFGDNWFVASGEVDQDMFYSVGRRSGERSIVAHLTYPFADRERWDPLTVLLHNSFRLTGSRKPAVIGRASDTDPATEN